MLKPFHNAGLFLSPLKTSEDCWFSDVFRGYKKTPVTWNGSPWHLCVLLYYSHKTNLLTSIPSTDFKSTIFISAVNSPVRSPTWFEIKKTTETLTLGCLLRLPMTMHKNQTYNSEIWDPHSNSRPHLYKSYFGY